MSSLHTAYKSEDIFNQLSAEEKLHVHSYGIAEIIRSIAENHPKTLELVLALAGPDVAEQIEDIYGRFLDPENVSDNPIEIGTKALRTIHKVDLAIETLHGDQIANETSLDDFKNLIVKK